LSWVRITPVLPEGQAEVPLAQRPFVDIEAVSPEWFETMQVPLRAGRAFTRSDSAQAPPVVLVNETLARRYWPNESAVGKHIVVGRRPQPAQIIGVAADIRNQGLEQKTQPQLYLPFPQLPWSSMYLLVRTTVPAPSLAVALRAQIAAVDRDQPVIKVQTAEELIDTARTQPRLLLGLVGAFSALALALAVVGIYATLSYAVAQRRQEFAIRLAMGAKTSDILRLVLRQGSLLAVAGIVPGLMAAFLLTRLAASMLYQTETHDWLTFVLAPAVFFVVSVAASYLPALRAAQADPIEALR
jgi:putative ABC transport system permease protein